MEQKMHQTNDRKTEIENIMQSYCDSAERQSIIAEALSEGVYADTEALDGIIEAITEKGKARACKRHGFSEM